MSETGQSASLQVAHCSGGVYMLPGRWSHDEPPWPPGQPADVNGSIAAVARIKDRILKVLFL